MSYLDTLCMGPDTHQIDLELYKLNRDRLLENLTTKGIEEGVILLQGGKEIPVYNSDQVYYFRQEPFFQWTFGIVENDCYGAIEVKSGKTIGFFPHLPDDYNIWSGKVEELDFFKTKYNLDEVYYVDDIEKVLKELNQTLLVLKGINTDSGHEIKEPEFPACDADGFSKDNCTLYNEMCELRSIKTDLEIEVLKYVIKVTSEAHKQVMKFVRPGKFQYQCESLFRRYCHGTMGSSILNYPAICCSGRSCGILHYLQNDQEIKDGEMCLFDMSGSYFGYTGDITCSFPANGRFTNKQRTIYEAVFDAFNAVIENARPDVSWECMHTVANKVLLQRLEEACLISGDIEAMLKADIPYIFQPHGLGHLMGMNVHDVGGYLEGHPKRPTKKSSMYLRTTRKLVKGMVITVEPGCYFINALLEKGYKDKNMSQFLVKDIIDQFKHIGGVRIEGNIVITESGNEVLEDVPRAVVEIENFMRP